MTAGTTVLAPDGTEVVLGEIGTRVLLENSRVRVWEVARGLKQLVGPQGHVGLDPDPALLGSPHGG